MDKMFLSSVQFVERAAWLSRELTRMRCAGPGTVERAMRQLEATYGIPFSVVWRLRHRQQECKSICAAIYARLESAYVAECERQQAKLAHEIEVAKMLTVHLVGSPDVEMGSQSTPEGSREAVGETDGG